MTNEKNGYDPPQVVFIELSDDWLWEEEKTPQGAKNKGGLNYA